MKKFLQTKGERETKGWTSVVSPEIRTRRALTTNYYGFQYFFTTSPSFALTGPMIHGGWLRINLFMQCKLELNSVQYISRKFYFHTVKLPFGSVLCSLYSHLKYEEQDTFFLPNQFVHTKSTKTLESQFLHKLMYTFWTISLSCGSITIWFCFFRERGPFIFSTDPLFNFLHNFSCDYHKTLLDRKLLRCLAKDWDKKHNPPL